MIKIALILSVFILYGCSTSSRIVLPPQDSHMEEHVVLPVCHPTVSDETCRKLTASDLGGTVRGHSE